MKKLMRVVASAVVLAAFQVVPMPAAAGNSTVVEDGAWCWFADSRAVHYSGIFDRTYIGSITANGTVQIMQYDHTTRQTYHSILHTSLQVDDHDNPAILVRADRRLIVFYSKHGAEPVMYYRISKNPEDATEWGAERKINTVRNTTYPNPVMLSGENNRIYLFSRSIDWKPTMQWSDDQGENWSAPKQFLKSTSPRPYMKVESNGVDEIYFAYTDGHPRDAGTNSIYFLKYRADAFYKADGTQVGTKAALPLFVTAGDRVYDGASATGRGWIWDLTAINGQPTLTYSRLPTNTNHEYRYAYFDGTSWQDKPVVAGGQWFPQTPSGATEPEPHYSGGVVLDHADPSIVYTSRPINGQWEIEKWTTANKGTTWSTTAITSNSTERQVRPYVIKSHKAGEFDVAWMAGRYVHYTNYKTAIRTNFDFAAAPASLRFDMGTASSPLASGFTRVSEQTLYRAGGFGWVTASAADNKTRFRGTADAMTSDFAFNSLPRKFQVALGNKSYTVKVTSGDSAYAHDGIQITANGTVVASNVASAVGAYTVTTFTVNVTNGLLTLDFAKVGGGRDPNWVVNAVEIN